MYYNITIFVGTTLDLDVEAEDIPEAEEKAIEMAKKEVGEKGIKDPEYEVDSIMEILEENNK